MQMLLVGDKERGDGRWAVQDLPEPTPQYLTFAFEYPYAEEEEEERKEERCAHMGRIYIQGKRKETIGG